VGEHMTWPDLLGFIAVLLFWIAIAWILVRYL
jgi:hypothetical protein